MVRCSTARLALVLHELERVDCGEQRQRSHDDEHDICEQDGKGLHDILRKSVVKLWGIELRGRVLGALASVVPVDFCRQYCRVHSCKE